MRQNQNGFAERLSAVTIAERSAIHKALMKRDACGSALAMRAHLTAGAKRLERRPSLDGLRRDAAIQGTQDARRLWIATSP